MADGVPTVNLRVDAEENARVLPTKSYTCHLLSLVLWWLCQDVSNECKWHMELYTVYFLSSQKFWRAFPWVSQHIAVEMKHVWESLYLRTIHQHDPRDLSRNTIQNRSETATQNTTVCSFCTLKLKDSKATVISAYSAELKCWKNERLDFAFVAQTICNMTFAWILMVKNPNDQIKQIIGKPIHHTCHTWVPGKAEARCKTFLQEFTQGLLLSGAEG